MWKVAIVVASNKASRGERVDNSGPAVKDVLTHHLEANVIIYRVLPDCIETLKENMIEITDRHQVDLLVTVGGTGLSPDDVTPEATRQVIDRVVPGMAEEMRRKALESSRLAMFTRAICGTRGNSLIINLPGAVQDAQTCLEAIIDQLPNALTILRGEEGVNA
ncbi:molybdenum cofactor synthesis domain-containing protein [Caldalkalibacillus uzonensis]|uniref:Molybdenum cofactor synthesis domain-containing protein n=1 Tax=Caldalkalibacillus uzonensis TaxID=353224 RepID=A0ABU0CVI9_9BACI|nr:MogA/MoaB family molybdenum cofactor biosynthesis protein [Caldalkalibacillus uzonensis]MDQ0340436.1 molybdenum cofactor synthesis domain-containing protein [Caldalkalibacillus uzonensis]